MLGDREDEGVHFAGDRAEEYGRGLRLTLAFNVPEENARVSRHFVTYPGTSVIETWFDVERLDGSDRRSTSRACGRGASGSPATRFTGSTGCRCWTRATSRSRTMAGPCRRARR